MDSGGLISKYLPLETQVSLLSELVKERRFDEVVGLLDATQLGEERLEEIDDQILEVLKDKLETLSAQDKEISMSDDEELRSLSQLSSKIGSLLNLFESWISGIMFAYVAVNRVKLFHNEGCQDLLFEFLEAKRVEDAKKSEMFDLVVLLDFLAFVCLFSDSTMRPCNSGLDAILISLIGCNDDVVASKSSKLMRWRINAIAERCAASRDFDKICWSLMGEVLKSNERNGMSFLLRFLTVSQFTPGLEEFVRKDDFWTVVQAALNDNVQEYRKIGLSVLKLTIKGIPDTMDSFETRLFSWNPLEKSKLIYSWKNFTTLYEIVSLDTALNQIEAASEDILNLFKDTSLHPTWGLVLFSTGLRASMESVRKYMVALLFRIRDKSVLTSDVISLRKIFLPSLMEAHFFNTDGKTCSYGNQLTKYICEVLSDSGEEAPIAIETILKALVDQGGSFDPARIYTSLGILEYLEKETKRPLTLTHLDLISKLYEFENEDAVYETTIQTIYLKYLLHVSSSVSSSDWVQCLVSHIKRNQNDYEFIYPVLDLFKDFASDHYKSEVALREIEPYLGKDPTTDLLSLILFNCKNISPTRELLIEVARSRVTVSQFTGIAQRYMISLLAAHNIDSESYDCTDVLVNYPGLGFTSSVSFTLSPLFQSVVESFSSEKFKFFVQSYRRFANKCADIFQLDWRQLVKLYQVIKASTSDPTFTNFKVKDEVYGSYFKLLHFSLVSGRTKVFIKVSELINLLEDNINKDNGNFSGNKGVARLCAHILTNYTTHDESQESWDSVLRVYDMLGTIWDSFSCERLVLKQKSLHLATINGLFHPTVLFYASLNSRNGMDLSERVHQYGEKVVEQAYSRRCMLPLMSDKIQTFVRNHEDKLKNADLDYRWLIDSMTSIFTCDQTNVNMFRLKTVIADLFDQKLASIQETSGLYERAYGVEEVSAKIKIIATLLDAPHNFKEAFISRTFHCGNLLSAQKKTDGLEEIQRLQKWQLVLLCIKDSNKIQLIANTAGLILENLLEEVSPIIRIYMEWTIALLLIDNIGEQMADDLISELFSLMDDHSRPIVVVSAERIIFLLLKALVSTKSQQFYLLLAKFTSVLIPNATSSKPLVRHFSNSLMLLFWPSFQEFVEDPVFRLTMKGLYDKAVATKMTGKYRAGDANVWDIKMDLTLTGIFGGVLKKTIDHDLPYITKDTFIKYLPAEVSISIGQDDTSVWLSKRSTKKTDVDTQDSLSNSLSQLQTKSGAWESLMTLDNDSTSKAVKRSDLIVVSSLVDKPPNLGGICRLCDVLGVGLLTVQDIRVKNHPQFKNVAVTADRWMPMAEVPIQGISNFMREKKREGYVLIGLEQTDKSVKLDTEYKFPRKSLILLGTEAHGIPGELLNQLDLCLEIQQFGVIRSMNIQTATAVIVHSYTIQHM